MLVLDQDLHADGGHDAGLTDWRVGEGTDVLLGDGGEDLGYEDASYVKKKKKNIVIFCR